MIAMINHKNYLFREYKMGRVSHRDANNYKLLVNRQLRFVKKQYFDCKFNECSNNIRKT